MEFYEKHPFNLDEDTTDTEDDSGIAEIGSPINYANSDNRNVNLDPDAFDADMMSLAPGDSAPQTQQPQDALGKFFSYWWVTKIRLFFDSIVIYRTVAYAMCE